jgi:hypothetical protein
MPDIMSRQIKKIKALQHRLGIEEEEYQQLLSDYWVNSCTKLTYDEAKKVIGELEKRAIEKGVWQNLGIRIKKYDDLGKRPGMASPKQLRMIEAMWKDASWTHDAHKRELALRKFIFRIAAVDDMTFLTSQGASKVITAIGNIKRKHTTAKCKGGAACN